MTKKEKAFLDIVKRLISDPQAWNYVDEKYGAAQNSLYIDGCINYKDETEAQLVKQYVRELLGKRDEDDK